MLKFTVFGAPVAQGEPIPIKRGRKVGFLSRPEVKAWRRLVVIAAKQEWVRVAHPAVVKKRQRTVRGKVVRFEEAVCYADEPVLVWVTFYLRGNRSQKPGDPLHCVPDTDKLYRSIGDALSEARIVSDDRIICGWPQLPAKVCGEPRASIMVESLREYYERIGGKDDGH